MRYADEAAVFAQLKLDPVAEGDAAAIARVVALEEGLALTLDEKLGTSFGVAPVAETRTVAAPPSRGLYEWTSSSDASRLILTTPVRSITGIETGGSWNGTAWINGATMTVDQYRLTHRDRYGLYYAIESVFGSWNGVVRITGVWADQPTAAVPADVREAMTFVTAETYRMQHASPADEIGPDGLAVRPRNPWAYEQVKGVVSRYQTVRVLA
jgi:hypothetical protein